MSRATYNITNDKLKAFFEERLSKENYDRMRKAGFAFWHGAKCFAGKWSPQAEDLLKELGIPDIEQDDQPDNVEARVERFAGYAQASETQAGNSETYLAKQANTTRRRETAIRQIQKGYEEADYWNRRIEASIRHAQFKDRPDVIARRIEGLEKSKRKFINDSTPNAKLGAVMHADNQIWMGQGNGVYRLDKDKLPELQARVKRWIDHLDLRLTYEKALLAAAGGIVAGGLVLDREKFQVGGAIRTRRGGFEIITKINQRTVETYAPSNFSSGFSKVDRTEIMEFKTPEEVKAELPHLKAPDKSSNQLRIEHRSKLEQQRENRRAAGMTGYLAL